MLLQHQLVIFMHSYCKELNLLTGTYAFRLPDENGDPGLWISYEDPDTAGQKAAYVKLVYLKIF